LTRQPWNGRLLVEPLMRATLIVVCQIFIEHISQVSFVDDQDMV